MSGQSIELLLGIVEAPLNVASLTKHFHFRFNGTHLVGAVLLLAVRTAADAWVMITLDRLGRRAAREVWSGLVAAAPTVLAVLTVAAIVEPFVRVTVAMSNGTQMQRREMERREEAALVGVWRPVSRLMGQRAMPVDSRELLVIREGLGFRWVRDGGTSEGSIRLHFHQNPLGMTIYGYGAEGWTGDRTGIYKWDGGRLTVALGRINAFGSELPACPCGQLPFFRLVVASALAKPDGTHPSTSVPQLKDAFWPDADLSKDARSAGTIGS